MNQTHLSAPKPQQLGAGVVSKGSYSLHLVAILLDLCAFSMLCVAWSRPLQISQDHEKVRKQAGMLYVGC